MAAAAADPAPAIGKKLRVSAAFSYSKERDEAIVKARSGFVLRKMMGECMLMPAGDNIKKLGGALLLNPVSAFVWEKLQEPATREELLAAILERYQIDPETAARDLDGLLEKLKSFDVIEE